MKSPFEILNISDSCTDEEVKTAYLKLIRQFPPERHPEKFKEIKMAFELLKTERDRIAFRLFNVDELTLSDLWTAVRAERQRIPAEKLLRIISELAEEDLKQLIQKKITKK